MRDNFPRGVDLYVRKCITPIHNVFVTDALPCPSINQMYVLCEAPGSFPLKARLMGTDLKGFKIQRAQLLKILHHVIGLFGVENNTSINPRHLEGSRESSISWFRRLVPGRLGDGSIWASFPRAMRNVLSLCRQQNYINYTSTLQVTMWRRVNLNWGGSQGNHF